MSNTTFKFTNTNSDYTFRTTDYSKILDNIIAANIKANNKYLNNNDDFYTALIKDSKKYNTSKPNGDILDTMIDALFGKKKNAKKFYLNKIYKLADGTPLCFYDDEIQIGYDTYSYDNFNPCILLAHLSEPQKKIIINIIGNNKNIKINIL